MILPFRTPTRLAGLAIAFASLTVAQMLPAAAQANAASAKGDVTRAQMQAEVNKVFDQADTNKDGFMSNAEFRVRMGAVLNRTPPGTPDAPTKDEAQKMLDAANAAFKAVDVNGDGKLSRAETSKRPLTAFDNMDANHDGVLTLAEKIAAHTPPPAAATPKAKAAPGR